MTIPLSPQKPSFSPKIKTFSFPPKSKIKIQNLGWERRKSRSGTSENDWPIIFTSQSSPYSPFDKLRKGTWYNDEEARILDRLQGWLAVALQMQGFLSSIILNWEMGNSSSLYYRFMLLLTNFFIKTWKFWFMCYQRVQIAVFFFFERIGNGSFFFFFFFCGFGIVTIVLSILTILLIRVGYCWNCYLTMFWRYYGILSLLKF